MFCPNCDYIIEKEDALFCPICGYELLGENEECVENVKTDTYDENGEEFVLTEKMNKIIWIGTGILLCSVIQIICFISYFIYYTKHVY